MSPRKRTAKKPEPSGKVVAGDLRRRILPGDVPEPSIIRILDAAHLAPSAANLQPWVFLLVRDEATRRELAALGSRPGGEPFRELFWRDEVADPSGVFASCGAVVLVFGERKMPMWRESCWAAIARMDQAALDEGLVAVVYEPPRAKELMEFFGVPDVYLPVAVVALGRPDGTFPVAERKPLETVAMEHRRDGPNRPIGPSGPMEPAEPGA